MHHTQDGHVQRLQGQNRYGLDAENQPPAPDAWIAAAVDAATLGELYDAATVAQASGAWHDRDATWCRVLRDALGAQDRAALALVRRELGAVSLDAGVAS